ncbi:uncharacterized protein LOC133754348 isoform X2 [Lepus europaeus]|uniref:uncharacterized protein LOC133754348 isoform X2 n=1 Tax=Lepus europaeus TaxID=9983 RepID=UPI002B4A9F6C|nr:uncharacterized protein LOC133754348 isoform X2 [Lepus europaeus]
MDGILPPPQNQAVDSCCVGRERCLQTYLGFGDRCRSEQKPARGSTSNPPGTTRKILSRLRMPMPRPWMFLGIVHRSLPGEPAALRQPAPTIAPIVTGVRKGRHSQLDFAPRPQPLTSLPASISGRNICRAEMCHLPSGSLQSPAFPLGCSCLNTQTPTGACSL